MYAFQNTKATILERPIHPNGAGTTPKRSGIEWNIVRLTLQIQVTKIDPPSPTGRKAQCSTGSGILVELVCRHIDSVRVGRCIGVPAHTVICKTTAKLGLLQKNYGTFRDFNASHDNRVTRLI